MTSSVSVFCDIVHLQILITPLWFCIWQDQQTAVVRCLPKISLHCTSWRHFSVRRISTVTSFRKAFIAWLLHHFYMVEWFYLLNAFCGKTTGTLRRKILLKEVFRRWNLKNSWFTHRKSLLEMTSKLELNVYVKKEQNQAWSMMKRTWQKNNFFDNFNENAWHCNNLYLRRFVISFSATLISFSHNHTCQTILKVD